MDRFGIDPWNDELGQRYRRAKESLMCMRGDNEIENAHFPRDKGAR